MKKSITTPIPNGILEIKISTDGCGGNPYFSITADEYEHRKYGRAQMVACGCLHEEILKARPDLKSLVDIHLSDLDGVPMYAEANGWYWLAKAAGIPQEFSPDQSAEDCFVFFANHTRLPVLAANTFLISIHEAFKADGEFEAREVWKDKMEDLKIFWKAQANAALEMIEKIP